MTNLISCRRSSSTSLIHLFTATDCSSSPAGVAAANNVIVAAFNKLCDLVAPSLSLPIENACSLSRASKSDLPKCSTASLVRDSSRNGKKLLTMEKKGSRRWMSGGSNRLGLDILSWEFSNLEKLTSCDVVSKREHFYQ
ncbi:uncharacterized protein [Arachis hypogaea]|uniref:uncharacterized protein isoform X3 n=1 Tax=Arachis hypogaea TaxID=3818 RepID=UPI0010FC46FB|nr:uncharacterized protein LOC112721228 isoform X7 [Arachis hypogaea]